MRCKVAPQRTVYWQGHDRHAGEIIDMPEKEARINIKLGQVTDAEKERPLRVAEPQPVRRGPGRPRKNPDDTTPGRYRRADMRADETN